MSERNPIADAAIAVCIATRDRAASLHRLLQSLDQAQATAGVATQIIVADNGSRDHTPELLARWSAAAPGRACVRVEPPGKSRALNQALPLASAPLLAFTDDDATVTPGWLAAVVTFFAQHPHYDAAMGRIRIPPEVTDPKLLVRVTRYGTLPLFDEGDAVHDLTELYGCNMVLRRHVFERVGTFDERLGPGATGLCEDTDLSHRARRAGMRIGYMPEAIVHHSVDPDRLTPQRFRAYHVAKARGDFVIDPHRPMGKSLGRLVDAGLWFVCWTLARQPARRAKARGRLIRHREFLRLRWSTH